VATLRPCEERDARGNLIRLNPSITFKSDREIRKVKGRHDWDLIPNPMYHEPITVQVQGRALLFFKGVPDNAQTRAHAKEISAQDVNTIAPYIIEEIRRNPVKVRETRPTVYEVRVASVLGASEEPQIVEHTMQPGQTELTVEPVAVELDINKTALANRGGRPVDPVPAQA